MEKSENLQPNNKTVWHLESVFEVIPILGPKAGPSAFIMSLTLAYLTNSEPRQVNL